MMQFIYFQYLPRQESSKNNYNTGTECSRIPNIETVLRAQVQDYMYVQFPFFFKLVIFGHITFAQTNVRVWMCALVNAWHLDSVFFFFIYFPFHKISRLYHYYGNVVLSTVFHFARYCECSMTIARTNIHKY